MSVSAVPPAPVLGCRPEHSKDVAVLPVLAVLSQAGVPLADVSHSADACSTGVVAGPSSSYPRSVHIEFVIDGAARVSYEWPVRQRRAARRGRNAALEECGRLLERTGLFVWTWRETRVRRTWTSGVLPGGRHSVLAIAVRLASSVS